MASVRAPQKRGQPVFHAGDPDTADLFVIRYQKLQGRFQIATMHNVRKREHFCQKTLHVGSAPAEQLVTLAGQFERRHAPVLSFCWHHVGMRRQKQPAVNRRPDFGVKPGFGFLWIEDLFGTKPTAAQEIVDIGDHGKI